MSYIVDIRKLQPGDIMLIRFDDKLSKFIREMGGSEYSHAMICVGHSSVIEAGEIVEASNPVRMEVSRIDDIRVLRLKAQWRNYDVINKSIEYARMVIAMQYSDREAYRSMIAPVETQEPNRQICTRLVAQSFHYAGVDIVENIDYCTVKDIEKSQLLEEVTDAVMEVTPEINEELQSYTILEKQTQILKGLMKGFQELYGEDIQTFEQLTPLVLKTPDKTEKLAQIIKTSGYLDLWKEEEIMNPQNFDTDLFEKHYGEHTKDAAKQNYIGIMECLKRFTHQHNVYGSLIANYGSNEYFEMLLKLYVNLIDQCHRREAVISKFL